MKKKSYIIIGLLLFSMIPTIIPAVIAFNSTTMFGTSVSRVELFETLDNAEAISPDLPELTPFWIDMVDAEVVPNDGEGVYVAVLDTGLLPNWEFYLSQANIADEYGIGFTHEDVWWDGAIMDYAYDPELKVVDFITDLGSGHGTHVTSIITGFNYNNIFWIRGVAPKATIIPVLVLDGFEVPNAPDGYKEVEFGTDEMVAEGIYYAADLVDELDGPLIISMSLGGDVPAPMIEDAIDYAIDKGVIVVASAGNSDYEGMGWPGAYPQVISVAAGGWTEEFIDHQLNWLGNVPEKLNTEDIYGNNWQLYLEFFSSRPNKDLGQKSFHLDVTTPGSAIVGPYKVEFGGPEGYFYVYGTSQAAPHVSGIAAMVLQSYPTVTQPKMEKILKNAAHKLPLPCDGAWAYFLWLDLDYFTWYGNDYGAGFLQADAALKSVSKFVK